MRSDALQAAAAAPAADADPQTAKVHAQAAKAAEKFEAFFINQMLRQMRSGTREIAGDDSAFKDRVNEDMQDFADGQLADTMAGQRAFGIADVILRQLLPAQPVPSAQFAPPAVPGKS